MIDLGLNASDLDAFNRGIKNSHDVRIDVRILDQNEKPVGGLITDRVLSGAVQVDTTQGDSDTPTPTRQLTLELVDKAGKLDFVPDSPSGIGVFVGHFVRVDKLHWISELDDWIRVPVFQGPMTHLERAGRSIHLEAVGKETLALDPHLIWNPMTLHKGVRTVDAIRRIMVAMGETLFTLPEVHHTLHHTISLERHAQAWKTVQHLAASIDRQAFYDGRGRLHVRPAANRLWLFNAGKGGELISRPKLTFDVSEVRNIVELTGPKVEGPKKHLRAVARPNPNNPLSPESLKRNGHPTFLVDAEDVSHAKRENLLEARARHRLDNDLDYQVTAEFDCLPIPHLEELDRAGVTVEGREFDFRMQTFTIPLTSDSAMSVGSLRRVSFRSKIKTKASGGAGSGGGGGRP
jgi:hypothetical protein